MRFFIVCAWCNKLVRIEENEAGGGNRHTVSHAICESCKARILEEVYELTEKKPEAA